MRTKAHSSNGWRSPVGDPSNCEIAGALPVFDSGDVGRQRCGARTTDILERAHQEGTGQLPGSPKSAEALYLRLRSVGLEPARTFHIRNASIDLPCT